MELKPSCLGSLYTVLYIQYCIYCTVYSREEKVYFEFVKFRLRAGDRLDCVYLVIDKWLFEISLLVASVVATVRATHSQIVSIQTPRWDGLVANSQFQLRLHKPNFSPWLVHHLIQSVIKPHCIQSDMHDRIPRIQLCW